MKEHWRYLIARYGALPVVWCAAGEGAMPFYGSPHAAEDAALQKKGWTEVIRSMRATDPFHRMITLHPTQAARKRHRSDSPRLRHAPDGPRSGKRDRQNGAANARGLRGAAQDAGDRRRIELRRPRFSRLGRRVLSSDASRQMFWTA